MNMCGCVSENNSGLSGRFWCRNAAKKVSKIGFYYRDLKQVNKQRHTQTQTNKIKSKFNCNVQVSNP